MITCHSVTCQQVPEPKMRWSALNACVIRGKLESREGYALAQYLEQVFLGRREEFFLQKYLLHDNLALQASN